MELQKNEQKNIKTNYIYCATLNDAKNPKGKVFKIDSGINHSIGLLFFVHKTI
jgi:hypothetical protein